ncbi:hypothetical protein ACWIGC_23590, partial [Streptomyces diastaticus]
ASARAGGHEAGRAARRPSLGGLFRAGTRGHAPSASPRTARLGLTPHAPSLLAGAWWSGPLRRRPAEAVRRLGALQAQHTVPPCSAPAASSRRATRAADHEVVVEQRAAPAERR